MTRHTARGLPVHEGPAAWNAILGPDQSPAALDENTTADIVVIGAGFAGLSAARRLIQIDPTLNVTVLEAGDIAEGAAGRNSGFMIDIPHELTSDDYAGGDGDRILIGLNRKAQAFAEDAVADFGIPSAFFDRAGKINGAVSARADAHNESLSKHLAELDEPFEVLDAAAMAGITGSSYYRSGLYTPGTVMLQPAGYIRGLAQGLQRSGVEVYAQSPVLSFEHSGSTWTVATDKAKVSASRIILTTNGHLESFGFARGRLMHLFLYAVMTSELSEQQLQSLGGQARWGITPSDPMGTTVRRIDTALGGNRIVLRSCANLRPDLVPRARDLARAEQVMRRKFDDRFPNLSGLSFDYAWAGHLCLSRNGVSVARELERGIFSGCVQNGLGTARGTLTGIAAAEASLGESSDIVEFFRAQEDPNPLPPKPLQSAGGNLVLRWKEWLARSE